MIKKYLAAVVGLLALPVLSFAAYNDVTLTTDTVIVAGGVTFNVTGSSATIASITVGTSNFSMTLGNGSSATVKAMNNSIIGDDAPAANLSSSTCEPNNSTKTYTATGAVTITIFPNSVLCGTSSSGGTTTPPPVVSSGGGGVTPAVTTPTVVAPAVVNAPAVTSPLNVPAVVNANPSPVAMTVSPVFNRTFVAGQVHSDVKRLQQLLNSDPDTQVARSGVGSPGKETTKFGPATVVAVKKFQVKYGVAKPGQAGYGLFGPATRAKMAEVYGQGVSVSAPAPATSQSAKMELILKLLEQIKVLQAQLKAMQ